MKSTKHTHTHTHTHIKKVSQLVLSICATEKNRHRKNKWLFFFFFGTGLNFIYGNSELFTYLLLHLLCEVSHKNVHKFNRLAVVLAFHAIFYSTQHKSKKKKNFFFPITIFAKKRSPNCCWQKKFLFLTMRRRL